MPETSTSQDPKALWATLAQQAGLDAHGFSQSHVWVPPGTRSGTYVVGFSSPRGEHAVLKRFSETMEQDRFERITKTLRSAGEKMQGGANRVPTVLAVSHESRAVLFEWVRGDELYDLIEEAEDHAPLLTRAGSWLAAYHGAGPIQETPFWPKPHIEWLRELRRAVTMGHKDVCDRDDFLAL